MLKTLAIFGLPVLLALLLVHRVIFRTRCGHTPGQRKVRSDSGFERLIHLGLSVGFLALAGTGFTAVVQGPRLEDVLLQIHMAGAGLFILCLTAATLRWAADARFVPADGLWLKACGGFLKRGAAILPGAPDERFDAGQKLFFWLETTLGLACLVTALLSMFPILSSQGIGTGIVIHAYCALALLFVVAVHVYVGLIVKPKAWRRILLGRTRPRTAATEAANSQPTR